MKRCLWISLVIVIVLKASWPPAFAQETSENENESSPAAGSRDPMGNDRVDMQALMAMAAQHGFIKEKMDALSPHEMAVLQQMAADPQHSGKFPRLLAITVRAKRASEFCKQKDPGCPEDAYRHVLWSYYLTKEFGPQYAKVVTDAYEDDSIRATGNAEADHKMDYQNNDIGRRYAQQGTFSDNEILAKLSQDPEVILSA